VKIYGKKGYKGYVRGKKKGGREGKLIEGGKLHPLTCIWEWAGCWTGEGGDEVGNAQNTRNQEEVKGDDEN